MNKNCTSLIRNWFFHVIVNNYNLKKPIPYKGSAIFIHLTKNYKPTAGCIALKKKGFINFIKNY